MPGLRNHHLNAPRPATLEPVAAAVAAVAMGKRKNEAPASRLAKKKRAIPDDEAHRNFRHGLFDASVLAEYTNAYAQSQPYAPNA